MRRILNWVTEPIQNVSEINKTIKIKDYEIN
jgi:hypothetical protein